MPNTLLLADDSVTIRKVVGITFANEDVELVTESNGEAALARAREIVPDIVLADVSMPGMDGYELCAAIKAEPSLARIPVILLTGTFETFDESRMREVGANGHIAKPFEAQALVDLVHETLDRASRAETPAAAGSAEPSVPAPEGSLERPSIDPLSAQPLPPAQPGPDQRTVVLGSPEAPAEPAPSPRPAEPAPSRPLSLEPSDDFAFADFDTDADLNPSGEATRVFDLQRDRDPESLEGGLLTPDARGRPAPAPSIDPTPSPALGIDDTFGGPPAEGDLTGVQDEPRAAEPARAAETPAPSTWTSAPPGGGAPPVPDARSPEAVLYDETTFLDPRSPLEGAGPRESDPLPAGPGRDGGEDSGDSGILGESGPAVELVANEDTNPQLERQQRVAIQAEEALEAVSAMPRDTSPPAPVPAGEHEFSFEETGERATAERERPVAAALQDSTAEPPSQAWSRHEEIAQPASSAKPLTAGVPEVEPEPIEAEPMPSEPEPLELQPEPDAGLGSDSGAVATPPTPDVSERPASLGWAAQTAGTESLADRVAAPSKPELDPEAVKAALERIAWDSFGSLSEQLVAEVLAKVEEIAWEVLPQLAEKLIRAEIEKLKSDS